LIWRTAATPTSHYLLQSRLTIGLNGKASRNTPYRVKSAKSDTVEAVLFQETWWVIYAISRDMVRNSAHIRQDLAHAASPRRPLMPDFGTARSTFTRIAFRFSDCIRQVRVTIPPVEKLADLGASDAICHHLLYGLTAEILIASVRMFRYHVEPLS
jgi:hypothetical protein